MRRFAARAHRRASRGEKAQQRRKGKGSARRHNQRKPRKHLPQKQPAQPQANQRGFGRSAERLSGLDIQTYRLHPLKGGLKGFWSITVRANWA